MKTSFAIDVDPWSEQQQQVPRVIIGRKWLTKSRSQCELTCEETENSLPHSNCSAAEYVTLKGKMTLWDSESSEYYEYKTNE